MSQRRMIGHVLFGLLILTFASGQAQEPAEEAEAERPAPADARTPQPADDYVEVWSVIEQQWEAAQRGDRRWVEELLSADFKGWPKDSPAPRDKASTRMWNDFDAKLSRGLAHELYPLATVIHGNTAVAHYLYTNASEDKDGNTEVVNGRYTDVLVRVDGQWKFIAWHGGDDD